MSLVSVAPTFLRKRKDPSVGLMAIGTVDRELNIAAERIEEAVMWAVKHITR